MLGRVVRANQERPSSAVPGSDEMKPLSDAELPARRVSWDWRYSVRTVSSTFPGDTMDLQVVEHGPDTRVVTVAGEVDALNAPELAASLTEQLVVAQLVVVDLDGVRLLASAGMSVLFEAGELATSEDRELRLVCHSRTVNLALEITGLRERLPFADSVPDALNTVP